MLERRVLANTEEEKKALLMVLNEFFTYENNEYRNKRADEEISEYKDKHEKVLKAAEASAKARQKHIKKSKRSTDAEQTLNGCSTDAELTKNQEPRTKNENIKEPLTPKGEVAVATKRVAVALIPVELDSELFRSAWDDFIRHRIEKRCKMTPTMAEKLLAKLATYGQSIAIQAINASITNGWQGVFPEKIPANSEVTNSAGFVDYSKVDYTLDWNTQGTTDWAQVAKDYQ